MEKISTSQNVLYMVTDDEKETVSVGLRLVKKTKPKNPFILMSDVDNWVGYVCRSRGIWQSLPSSQFCCKSKTDLKNERHT